MSRALLGVSIFALVACCGCSEHASVSHGWTPKWIPSEIPDGYEPRTGADEIPLGAPFLEFQALHSDCAPLSGEPAQLPQHLRSWWPLRSYSHGNESSGAYRYYRCNKGGATTYVVADAEAGTAYFWRE